MMKRYFLILPLLLAVACTDSSTGAIEPVDFSSVIIEDGFWAPRLENHKSATIPICIDQIENCTGRMRNFDKVASGEGEHEGFFFDDSDVYKALEGFAYSLIQNPDPELEAKCDDWIDRIAAAQQEDGYLNTYFTLARPDDRWTDMDKHELYCLGHMIEASIAYWQASGKRKFLDVAERMTAHVMEVMGPGKMNWVPGHEEIELALVKLYRATGKSEYLELASWLLEERGRGYGIYSGNDKPDDSILTYYQDKVPVSELTDICGHAVRAMYLYCGMADVASYTGNASYVTALDSLWNDVVLRNMYITGGIGQSAANEGITEDYDLPNREAYCETCASIGMVLWNARMNRMTADSKYADIMEKSLYNGVLAGVSLSGDRFFYVNPLESEGDRHRHPWFGCACCPSNICRFLPSVGGYVYGTSKGTVWINLYIGNHASFEVDGKELELTMKTDYPWDGAVRLTLDKASSADLMLRVPQWCRTVSFTVNGEELAPELKKGYACLPGPWKAGDTVEMVMDMPVELVSADPRVKADLGKRAVCRGPLVYCAEEVDNPDFDAVRLSSSTAFSAAYEPELLNGAVGISSESGLRLVPYCTWCNRTQGKMKVWIDLEE